MSGIRNGLSISAEQTQGAGQAEKYLLCRSRQLPVSQCMYDLHPQARSFCDKDFAGMVPNPEPVPEGSSLLLWITRQVI